MLPSQDYFTFSERFNTIITLGIIFHIDIKMMTGNLKYCDFHNKTMWIEKNKLSGEECIFNDASSWP